MIHATAPEVLLPASSPASDSRVASGLDNTRLLQAVILVAVTAFQVPIFLAMARHRIIDGDEGFYLLASRLVFEHKLPYRDFLYLQTPLLPYAYGLWMQIAGYSWLAARTLSVLFAAFLGTLLYSHVRAQTGKWLAGLFAVALYVASPDILGWFTTVKTYALSCLLLFGAYALLSRKQLSLGAICMAGFALGLGVDTRLFLLAAVPLFLFWLRSHPGAIRYFLLGLAVALSPNIYFFAADPQAYWFGNLGFHAIRSSAGLIGNFSQKFDVLAHGPGDFVLCLGLVFGTRAQTAKRPLALALLLLLVSVLPTPTYVQYFCIAIPFFILATVSYATEAIRNPGSISAKRSAIVRNATLILACVGISLWNGQYSPYPREYAGNWLTNRKWDTAEQVSKAIDRLAQKDEPVLTSWPGYLFASKAAAYPGSENHSGWVCAGLLSRSQRKKFYVISEEEIEEIIRDHRVRIAAVGDESTPPGINPSPPYRRLLTNAGYVLKQEVGDVSIWAVR